MYAAIEAPRARELGKGLTVVADEIRKLPESGKAFDEIAEIAEETAAITAGLAASGEEQTAVIQQFKM